MTTLDGKGAAIEKSGVEASIADISPLPTPSAAKPFLKWVGGKRQLLPEILRHMPEHFERYHEPFLGGGAVFFNLRPKYAFLTDSNRRLIRAYRGVQQDVEGVIRLLRSYEEQHSKRFFLKLRKKPDIDSSTAVEVAAWLIYLNRTGYNGLYRVNSRNIFNVPFGTYAKPLICDEDNLKACSEALKGTAELDPSPFTAVLDRARKGDFVYFDPPYVPLTATSKFTDYTSEGFGDTEQVQLRDVALKLKKKGVFVLLSNSSAPRVQDLYKDFEQIKVRARRSINSNSEGRGAIQELLLK